MWLILDSVLYHTDHPSGSCDLFSTQSTTILAIPQDHVTYSHLSPLPYRPPLRIMWLILGSFLFDTDHPSGSRNLFLTQSSTIQTTPQDHVTYSLLSPLPYWPSLRITWLILDSVLYHTDHPSGSRELFSTQSSTIQHQVRCHTLTFG